MSLSKKTRSRILGIDFGLARLGLALSDESHMMASPLMTFSAEKKLELTVDKLCSFLLDHQKKNEYILASIVVGLPLMLSGKSSQLTEEVYKFIDLLREKSTVTISPWDERLTTVQAERSLKEGGHLRRKQRAQFVDQASAVILLQSFLDRLFIQKEREQANG